MDMKTLFPVITLLIGLFLKEIETRFGANRNLRRAMNRALAELLDLHSVVAVHQDVVNRHQREESFSYGAELRMRIALTELLTNSAQAMTNYNAAIIEVAGEDPVLGSELRALHRRLEQLTSIINTVSSSSELTEYLMNGVERSVESIHKNVHDCAVKLARRLGRHTIKEARRYLASSHLSDPEDQKILGDLSALRPDLSPLPTDEAKRQG